MSLVLLQDLLPFKDGQSIADDDATQDYVDGDNRGWGQLGNPDRADRCLVTFAKYVNVDSQTEYITQQVSTQNDDKTIGVADGEGLSNTDKSRFVFDSGRDGHYIFYMIPIERYASAPAGSQGLLYYNTTDKIVYYYDGSSFLKLDTEHLPLIEGYQGISVREQIFDIQKRWCLARKTRQLIFDPPHNKQKIMKEIRELRNKDLLWWSTFKEGQQPTSRYLLKSVEDVC